MSRIQRSLLVCVLLLCPALAGALQNDLAWDYPDPAPVAFTEFRLYRSGLPDLPSFPTTPLLTGIAPAARAISDLTVTYATQYCYYVVAYAQSTGLESPPSNVACKTMPAEPPAPAINLRVTIRP